MFRKSPDFDNLYDCALRSMSEEINLADICSMNGGGGHFKAAGMSIPVPDFNKLIVVNSMAMNKYFEKWEKIKHVAEKFEFTSDIVNFRLLTSAFNNTIVPECKYLPVKKVPQNENIEVEDWNNFGWKIA